MSDKLKSEGASAGQNNQGGQTVKKTNSTTKARASRGAASSFVDEKMRDDPNYAPYCMRCRGLRRMRRVSPTLAECPACTAVHEMQNTKAEVSE